MRGVVVCPQPLAAEAGAAILEDGGNAFDAAVAAAFVQMATDPHMCGLGGTGCATYWRDGEGRYLDFHGWIGSRATPEMWAGQMKGRLELGSYPYFEDHRSNLGHSSVGTPGTVAGLAELHRHAHLPWAELLAPAAAICRDGFVAPDYLFEMARKLDVPNMPTALERMAHTPDSAALWCREDGTLKCPGDRWVNPEMAATLDRLAAAGPREFYEGALARQIAAELERGGGYVTLDDLRAFRVRANRPIEGTFRGLRILSSAPPAGGVTLAQILQILDRFEPGRRQDAAHHVLLAAAIREAFAARAASIGDPRFVDVPTDELLSAAWADAAAERIRRSAAPATPSLVSAGGTTHLSAYDEAGNAVALTHTLGLYSGVIVPGTGIPLNSTMDSVDPEPGGPNSIAPGKARISAQSPTIVLRDGRPAIITGSPGTNAIVTCVAQVLVNVIDLGLDPAAAVAAPRIHAEGGPTFVEGRISQATRQALSDHGFDVRPLTGNYVPGFGRNQLIVIAPDGTFGGASDPRRDGGVAAYSSRS
jgi:gamma-glutamyltranspeptidase/glutathione hydrolase